eukprot:6574167-Alexandrium_andersonii.AAC.1
MEAGGRGWHFQKRLALFGRQLPPHIAARGGLQTVRPYYGDSPPAGHWALSPGCPIWLQSRPLHHGRDLRRQAGH